MPPWARRSSCSTNADRPSCAARSRQAVLLPLVEDEPVALGIFAKGHVANGRLFNMSLAVELHAARHVGRNRRRNVIDDEHDAAARREAGCFRGLVYSE